MTRLTIISDGCTLKVMASTLEDVFTCAAFCAVKVRSGNSKASMLSISDIRFAFHTPSQKDAFENWYKTGRHEGYSFVVKPEYMQVVKQGYVEDVFTRDYPNDAG